MKDDGPMGRRNNVDVAPYDDDRPWGHANHNKQGNKQMKSPKGINRTPIVYDNSMYRQEQKLGFTRLKKSQTKIKLEDGTWVSRPTKKKG